MYHNHLNTFGLQPTALVTFMATSLTPRQVAKRVNDYAKANGIIHMIARTVKDTIVIDNTDGIYAAHICEMVTGLQFDSITLSMCRISAFQMPAKPAQKVEQPVYKARTIQEMKESTMTSAKILSMPYAEYISNVLLSEQSVYDGFISWCFYGNVPDSKVYMAHMNKFLNSIYEIWN